MNVMAVIRRPVPPDVDPAWLARQLARFTPADVRVGAALFRQHEQADRRRAAERKVNAA